MFKSLFCFIFLNLGLLSYSQQMADTSYQPDIPNPQHPLKNGPAVLIDEGHENFHTRTGRYQAFARLIERDGYQVGSYTGPFEEGKLKDCDILVISNALNESNVRHWHVPVHSAFTDREIDVIRNWVHAGGSLFLIADHMPMAGAAKKMAAAFGFTFYDGFAVKTNGQGPSVFTLENMTLLESPMTKGRHSGDYVNKVVSFTGQAFQIPEDAHAVMVMDDTHVLLMPDTAWQFHQATPAMDIQGWAQGAYKYFGKGRLAVFGEAAMFTAQVVMPQNIKAGMNVPGAEQNYQFLLNIFHWLEGTE